MKAPPSIRTRLAWGAFLVLLAFLAIAGWAVQQAYADSIRAQRFARLQTTIYLLMAGAELDGAGALVMPPSLAEPRLSLPGSGLYASISKLDQSQTWRSSSTVGVSLPFQTSQATGQWKFDTVTAPQAQSADHVTSGHAFLAATYAVKWAVNDQQAQLVFSVLEDKAGFDRELFTFERTLWSWLGATGVLLLLTQTLLLRWGLTPLGQMASEIQRIETGTQARVEGNYPRELAGLGHNLNLLIDQQRNRQTRYKEALDDLAHSLKTPLAAMRAALAEPAELPAAVAQQVSRMDDIVRHQLGRAGASGANRFAPYLVLAPLLHRIRDTLGKVYLDKNLSFTLACPSELAWRLDEGDAFEMLGNVLDNAAKWAKHEVGVQIWLNEQGLNIRVTDDGPGFAAPQAKLARGVRLDESVSGHGIGLSVVNDLVSSYLGALKISNAASGGAQVDIVLPRA
ncbi:ATP-binding protein [Rhodoferax sp.]|uniref:ATP-binding protein n=1 Tax=Rhodoferax sp. TaxID=50421 RepID=UPI00283AC7C0|nr:ATP-binding protein [Rhodoferax sp.]MDR3371273.1 ATP-binding protein [Rhodoferax sp.]